MFGLLSDDFMIWLNNSLNDVDGISSGTVSTGHFGEHLGNSAAKGGGSVFFVHVHNIGSSSILKDDSVVLDGVGFLLKDFTDRNDLTLALSNLVLSLHLVPELGSGKDDVFGEYSNSIACWLWIGFVWKLSTDNPELFDLFLHVGNSDTFDHIAS